MTNIDIFFLVLLFICVFQLLKNLAKGVYFYGVSVGWYACLLNRGYSEEQALEELEKISKTLKK